MKAIRHYSRSARRWRSEERTQRRVDLQADQSQNIEHSRDMALARLIAVLETAHAQDLPHLTGRFRLGNPYSRLARLRAAHATYALATFNMARMSEGAFVRA